MSKYYFQKKRSDSVFSPLMFSPSWWGDASDTSTITLSGSDVAQIDDKSGNGNHFIENAISPQPPFYNIAAQNGLNTMKFAGGTGARHDFLECVDNFVNTTSDTWFFVLNTDQAGFDNAVLLSDYGDVGAKIFVIVVDNDGAFKTFSVRDGDSNVLHAIDTMTSSFALLVLTREPGKITMDYAGSYQSVSGTYIATTYEGGNYPHLGVQGGSVIGDPNFADTYFRGNFCEGLRYPGVMSQTQIDTVKTYLSVKWGL